MRKILRMKKFLFTFAMLLALGAGCTANVNVDPDNDQANNGGNYDDVMLAELDDLIFVASPIINEDIESPVTVTGQARGTWFFEASFPVKVYDANNQLLGTGVAQAQGEWMTEEFVPFTATVTFSTPSTATGKIVLEKDNPSGLPENDNSLIVPVKF